MQVVPSKVLGRVPPEPCRLSVSSSSTTKPRISYRLKEDEFEHLTTSEFVSRFLGICSTMWGGPKHVVFESVNEANAHV